MALLIISPFRSVSVVVVAPPRNVPNPVKVDAPVTASVLLRVAAPVNVLAPVTSSVPPVVMFVLIVVAALTVAKTNTKDKNTDKIIESVLSFLKIFFIFYLLTL